MAHPQPKHRYTMTDLKAHEDWGKLSSKNPRASAVLHFLVARAGRYGSVTVSHRVLAEICGCGRNTVKRALASLEADRWLQRVRVGSERGGVNCYILNRGVCWSDQREKMAYVSLETRVVAAASEQPARALEHDGELRQVPALDRDEIAVPSGAGATPPAQQQLAGLEPVAYRDQEGRIFEHDPQTGELQQRLEDSAPV